MENPSKFVLGKLTGLIGDLGPSLIEIEGRTCAPPSGSGVIIRCREVSSVGESGTISLFVSVIRESPKTCVEMGGGA